MSANTFMTKFIKKSWIILGPGVCLKEKTEKVLLRYFYEIENYSDESF